jgi:hypothetical protein
VNLNEFPADVRQFIIAHVDSVAQLEVLLLLRENAQREWLVSEISDALRTSPKMVAEQAAGLEGLGVIAAHESSDGRFHYSPSTAELREIVDRLALVYEQRRVAVITMIYSKPVDKVQTFADAFRLRQEK